MSAFTPPPRPPQPPTPNIRPRDAGAAHKWQAIAALISAGVGALTFAVGFIGLPAAGVASPVAVRETATVTATATTTTTVAPPAGGDSGEGGASPAVESQNPEVQWSGPLLSQRQAFDLDPVPPGASIYGDIDPSGINGKKAVLVQDSYALVPEGEVPDFGECKLLATTKPQSELSVAEGRSVCLITDEGRVALATLDSVNSETGIVNLTVKVWEKTTP